MLPETGSLVYSFNLVHLRLHASSDQCQQLVHVCVQTLGLT